jgi:trimethylamine--corrinoid protein Co-methyltransferase
MIDSGTGQCRQGTLEDVKELTKVMEKAEHLSVVTSLLYPWDVPIEERDIATVETMLAYSTKHIYVQPYTGPSAERIAHIVQKAGSTRQSPYVSFIVSSTSPLVLSPNEIECLRVASRHGIPVMIGGTPICGATSPVTIASQVILAHAETLALYAILHFLNPESPATYGIRPATLDMRTGNMTWGDVEWGMASFVLAHLAHSMGFLTDVVGFPTDSKLPDFQAGAEKGFVGGILSLAPCNMIAGCGFIETILTASASQIVLDNELAGMFARAARGVEWDDAHRALDLMRRIGPGGNFLAEDHTVQFYREEFYQPAIFDRMMRHSWVQNGSEDIVRKALEEAKSMGKG